MDEFRYQQSIIRAAKARGWTVFVVHDSQYVSCKGWPDLTMRHPVHGVIVAELKSKRGRVTPEQHEWMDSLFDAGLRVYLWKLGKTKWSEVIDVLEGNSRADLGKALSRWDTPV